MDFLDKDWRYINEGNAHIVLQVLGTDYVLRLIKEDGHPVYLKAVQESVDFVNYVMLPLLSANHHLQDIVKIPAEKLAASANIFSHLRPEERKYKSVLSQYAIRDLNLTILSPNSKTNYCVEIKPKEGFISAKFQKLSKCYYCLKQFLKLHQNEIVGISNYCPVDLFSGDRNRMKYAIKSLIMNPQNNFKLFKDGNILYSNKLNTNDFENIMKNIAILGNSEMFVTFIVETLLNDKKYIIMLEESKAATVVSKFEKKTAICAEENLLKHDNFLYKLLYVQRLSENLDFTIEDKKCTGFEYVEAVVNRIKTGNINLKLESDMEKFLSTTDPKIIALISAIAKDCSIMISFSTDIEERFSTIQIGEYKISYKVSITDLEPKAAKTLAKRLKTEKQLIDIYEKHLNSTCK